MILVTVKDHTGNRRKQAKVNELVPVQRLMANLITAYGLPLTDRAGRQVSYRLVYEDRQLQDDETLESAGVTTGAVISLEPEGTAGRADIEALEGGNKKSSVQIFLCHSSGDKPAVRDLNKRLRVLGFSTWFDEVSLQPGQPWALEIARAVQAADFVLVCLTHNALNKEGYLHKEISMALDEAEKKPEGMPFIIPAKLEECDVPERLNRYHWAELYKPGGFERLVQAIRIFQNNRTIA